jgi:peptide/nickel transport system permease protein
MISESREFLPQSWWYALAPGFAIFILVMGFNLLGDGLRDILDPRMRRSHDRRQGVAPGVFHCMAQL